MATDMLTANIMGFEPHEVSAFAWANRVGMQPASVNEIEVRGETLESVRRPLVRPNLVPWSSINKFFGVEEIL